MKRGILLMLLIGLMAGTSQAAISVWNTELGFAGATTGFTMTQVDIDNPVDGAINYYDHNNDGGNGLQ